MKPITSDEGFSLTELIIVIAMLSFIMAAAYAALNAVQVSTDVSERQSVFAAEVGSPLLAIEEVLQQTLSVEVAGPYSITVTTDVDHDNLLERHIITAGVDGTLTQLAYNTDVLSQNTTLRQNSVWSTKNRNRIDSIPLFYYYDESHSVIADYTLVPGNAKSMDVIVEVQHEGRRFRSTRTVVLRNL
ncbi:MAG: prepilin-type N-terminal cleavage/methylation domain-containing protein [Coriobacteriia bacterium]